MLASGVARNEKRPTVRHRWGERARGTTQLHGVLSGAAFVSARTLVPAFGGRSGRAYWGAVARWVGGSGVIFVARVGAGLTPSPTRWYAARDYSSPSQPRAADGRTRGGGASTRAIARGPWPRRSQFDSRQDNRWIAPAYFAMRCWIASALNRTVRSPFAMLIAVLPRTTMAPRIQQVPLILRSPST